MVPGCDRDVGRNESTIRSEFFLTATLSAFSALSRCTTYASGSRPAGSWRLLATLGCGSGGATSRSATGRTTSSTALRQRDVRS